MTEAFRRAYLSINPLPVHIGPITRNDGTVVPLFCDTVPMMFWPESWRVLTRELVALVRDLDFDVVAGGLTPGAPLAAAVAYTLRRRFCWIRKEAKPYSQNRLIDGVLRPGERVVLFDDAFVHGEMKERFLEYLQRTGALPVAVCSVVVINPDVATDWAVEHGVILRYLATQTEIASSLRKRKIITPELERISQAFVQNMKGWNANRDLWSAFLQEKEKHKHLTQP